MSKSIEKLGFFEIILKLKSILPSDTKFSIVLLIFVQILVSLLDVLSVIFFALILSLLSGNVPSEQNFVFQGLLIFLNENQGDLLQTACKIGSIIFFAAFLANLSLIAWGTRFSQRIAASIGNNLFGNYLLFPLLDFEKLNLSKLANKIIVEVNRVASGIINPLIKLSSQAVFVLLSILMLLTAQSELVIMIIGAGSIVYTVIFFSYRNLMRSYSKELTDGNIYKLSLVNNAFRNFRNGIIDQLNSKSLSQFSVVNKRSAKLRANTQIIAATPKILIETLILISISLGALFFADGQQPAQIDILVLFGTAGLRLLPAIHTVYANIIIISQNQQSLIEITTNNPKIDLKLATSKPNKSEKTPKLKSLELVNVSFDYDGSPVLSDVQCKFESGSIYGLIGQTGSGKSTLCDIITGLIIPNGGNVLVNGNVREKHEISAWHRKIGFLPQDIQIYDTTIHNNITLDIWGENTDETKTKKLNTALQAAELFDFIKQLDRGLNHNTGDNGSNLSGGQKQRIGLARVLYQENDIIILDEPTAALDNVTEKMVFQNLSKLKKNMIIIIVSHSSRIEDYCDLIYRIQNEKISKIFSKETQSQ